LTPAGREKLRQSALKHRPWQFSTGPRTPEGKARIEQARRARLHGVMSDREIRRGLGDVEDALEQLAAIRQQIQAAL